jgi:hypothetical protein
MTEPETFGGQMHSQPFYMNKLSFGFEIDILQIMASG